jgi:hypothetical protein
MVHPPRDVRTREVGMQDIHHRVRPEEVELIRRDYAANHGWEVGAWRPLWPLGICPPMFGLLHANARASACQCLDSCIQCLAKVWTLACQCLVSSTHCGLYQETHCTLWVGESQGKPITERNWILQSHLFPRRIMWPPLGYILPITKDKQPCLDLYLHRD